MHVQRDLAIALSSESDLHRSMELILHAAVRIGGIDSGGVYLLDEQDGGFDLVASIGVAEPFLEAVSHYGPESRYAQLATQGHPVYFELDEGLTDEAPGRAEGLQALALVPVAHEGHVLAALALSSQHRLHLGDVRAPSGHRHAGGRGAGGVRADDAVRQSRANLDALFNSIEDACFVIGPDGTIVATNAAAGRTLGLLSEHIVGRPMWELHPPDRREEAQEAVCGFADGGEAIYRIPLLARDCPWRRD